MPTARHGIQAAECNGGVYIAAGGKTQGGSTPTNVHEAFFLNGPTSCDAPADTTAPTVSAVAPQEGATGVAIDANAQATFSEAMDASTIKADTFTLTKQGTTSPVTASVSYAAGTQTATLDPNPNLEANTTYTATVKSGANGVKDLAGNPLASDRSWSFSTGAGTAPPPDTTPPETFIDTGPSGTVKSRNASFTFSSSEAGSTFVCSLDSAAFSSCSSSPQPQTYSNLANGTHTFEVKATDAAGNTDPTPASRRWKVNAR
jgi:hypothetical protein